MKKNGKIKIVMLLGILLVCGLPCGCESGRNSPKADITADNSRSDIRQAKATSGRLTITGSGVARTCDFSLSDLQSMDAGLSNESYSAVNNWPAKKFYTARGVKVACLLDKAGIKDTAQKVIVRSADGYSAVLTLEQLQEKRYYFPRLMANSQEEAREVPAILAWAYQEGRTEPGKTRNDKLCLFLGQKCLHDVTTVVFVKDVVSLQVLSADPGQWPQVQAVPAATAVKAGTEVTLQHPQQDQVKIYYTLDGSTPTVESRLYNPSTSYYQPNLTSSIKIDKSMTIKAIATGWGRYDSPVAVFEYRTE
jgi:hypothetical protein